ncbi:MAG: hypothetical protein JW929_03260 [Anaerolineales bacterium]|nr:hypothetical protein [Anaerolineales bacterium]
MHNSAIQRIVCQAVVSDAYRARLLGSDRVQLLRSAGLDPREQEALLAIQAETIEEFAAGVERVARLWRQAAHKVQGYAAFEFRRPIEVDLPPRSG